VVRLDQDDWQQQQSPSSQTDGGATADVPVPAAATGRLPSAEDLVMDIAGVDRETTVAALAAAGGDVEAAVDLIFVQREDDSRHRSGKFPAAAALGGDAGGGDAYAGATAAAGVACGVATPVAAIGCRGLAAAPAAKRARRATAQRRCDDGCCGCGGCCGGCRVTGGLGKSSRYCTNRLKWGGVNTRAAIGAGGATSRSSQAASSSSSSSSSSGAGGGRGYRKLLLIATFPRLGAGQPGSRARTHCGPGGPGSCVACRVCRGPNGENGSGTCAHMTVLYWLGKITQAEVNEVTRIKDKYARTRLNEPTSGGGGGGGGGGGDGLVVTDETQSFLWNGHVNGIDREAGPLGSLIGECRRDVPRHESPAYGLHVSGGLCDAFKRPFDGALLRRHPKAAQWVDELRSRDPRLASGWELPLDFELKTYLAPLPANVQLHAFCERLLRQRGRGGLQPHEEKFLQALCNADCAITSPEQAKKDVAGVGPKGAKLLGEFFG
jgi:hypothetical protein